MASSKIPLSGQGGKMKLNLKALSLAAGIIAATAILITGIANLIWEGYGTAFLQMMASVYPGYHASGTIGDLISGTLYGFVDGMVLGLAFGWLYNRLRVKRASPETQERAIEP